MHGIRPRQKVTQADWASYMEARAERAQDEMLKRFFNTPMPDPDTPLSEVPMVALDMETTGLDERRHAIVSIGVVPFTLGRISMAQRRYWVVKPPRPLDEESIAYHHITHSEIADAPDLDSVLDELLAVLAGRSVFSVSPERGPPPGLGLSKTFDLKTGLPYITSGGGDDGRVKT